MSNTISNENIETIAASIFAKHGVDFPIAERAGGWTNAVWLTPELAQRSRLLADFHERR